MGTRASSSVPEHQGFRTTCGREIRVARLALGAERLAERVSLNVGQSPDHRGGTWAELTVSEARRLAAALLAQAAAADSEGQSGAAPAGRIEVVHERGESYEITVRGHAVLVDQPADAGGEDTAATPTELLVASLASCVAFYVGRFLVRHGLDRDGLSVMAEFTMAADRPARVGAVRLCIDVPGGVPVARQAALLAVASHCTVHNTLRQEPDVDVALVTSDIGRGRLVEQAS